MDLLKLDPTNYWQHDLISSLKEDIERFYNNSNDILKARDVIVGFADSILDVKMKEIKDRA
jgi:hypothetical protein